MYAAKVGNKVILFDAGADPDGKPIDALLGWLHASRGDITDVFFDARPRRPHRGRGHAGQA